MNKLLISVVLGVFVLAFASSVLAQEAIIRTNVDSNCPLIADGTTEYQLNVYADNTGLNGWTTDAIQWRVLVPSGLQSYINVTRVKGTQDNRPENDFFAGKSMFWERITTRFEDGHGRLTDLGQGVSNGQGNVVNYWFTISPNMPRVPVRTSFNLDATGFADPNGVLQPYRIENVPFVVLPNNFPFMSAKCRR